MQSDKCFGQKHFLVLGSEMATDQANCRSINIVGYSSLSLSSLSLCLQQMTISAIYDCISCVSTRTRPKSRFLHCRHGPTIRRKCNCRLR